MPSSQSRNRESRSSRPERSKGGSKASDVFQTVARGIIEYSAQKYLNRQQSSSESSHTKSSRRSTKSRGSTTTREPVTRHGSSSSSRGDGTAILGQIVVGLGALLVRRYLHHRKERKEKAKEEARLRDATRAPIGPKGDAELRAGLDALSSEAQRTSDTIRNLTARPPSHPNCEVHGALAQNADGLQKSLSNIQTGVNNIRNLNDDRLGRRTVERRRGGEFERNRDREGGIRRRDTERARDSGRPRRAPLDETRGPRSLERMRPRLRR